MYLLPSKVKCPNLPSHVNDPPVDETRFHIEGCDVSEGVKECMQIIIFFIHLFYNLKEVPKEIFAAMRKSRKFVLYIKDAQTLRIESDSKVKTTEAEIEALIDNR